MPSGCSLFRPALLVFSLSVLFSVFKTFTLSHKTGAVDLRNRVAAARQALAGHNPYIFKWQAGMPETLLDPADGRHNPDHRFTRFTSPPSMLALMAPAAGWDYQALKWLNFALNWCAFLAVAWLSLSAVGEPRLRALGLLFFSASAVSVYWAMHVERGQQYIFFSLIFAFMIWAARSRRPGPAAILPPLAAAAVLLRPAFAPLALAALSGKNRLRTALGAAACAAGLVFVLCLLFPARYWADYLDSSRDWFNMPSGAYARLGLPPPAYPPSPEGDPTMADYALFAAPAGGFVQEAVLRPLGAARNYPLRWALAGGLLAAFLVLVWRRRDGAADPALLTAQAVALLYLMDQALPAPRCVYNDVLALPVVLVAVEVLRPRAPRLVLAGLAGLTLLNLPLPAVLTAPALLAQEGLLTLLCGALCFLRVNRAPSFR